MFLRDGRLRARSLPPSHLQDGPSCKYGMPSAGVEPNSGQGPTRAGAPHGAPLRMAPVRSARSTLLPTGKAVTPITTVRFVRVRRDGSRRLPPGPTQAAGSSSSGADWGRCATRCATGAPLGAPRARLAIMPRSLVDVEVTSMSIGSFREFKRAVRVGTHRGTFQAERIIQAPGGERAAVESLTGESRSAEEGWQDRRRC